MRFLKEAVVVYFRIQSIITLRIYSSIHLKVLKKTMKAVTQDSQQLGYDVNSILFEYSSKVLFDNILFSFSLLCIERYVTVSNLVAAVGIICKTIRKLNFYASH